MFDNLILSGTAHMDMICVETLYAYAYLTAFTRGHSKVNTISVVIAHLTHH